MTFKPAPGTNRGPWMPASLQYLRTLAVTFAFSSSAFPLGALQVHLAQLCCRWHFDVRDWNVSSSCAINPEKENLPYTMYVLRVLANLYKNLKQNYQILSLKLKNLTLNRFPSKG